MEKDEAANRRQRAGAGVSMTVAPQLSEEKALLRKTGWGRGKGGPSPQVTKQLPSPLY